MSTNYYNNAGQLVAEDSAEIVLTETENGFVKNYKAKLKVTGEFFMREETVFSKRCGDISISKKTFDLLLKYYQNGGEYLYRRAISTDEF